MIDEFRAELHAKLREEGSFMGLFAYQWPDSFEPELYVDSPYFWELVVSGEMKEWGRTPAKAI